MAQIKEFLGFDDNIMFIFILKEKLASFVLHYIPLRWLKVVILSFSDLLPIPEFSCRFPSSLANSSNLMYIMY